jgi:hypothetical protein
MFSCRACIEPCRLVRLLLGTNGHNYAVSTFEADLMIGCRGRCFLEAVSWRVVVAQGKRNGPLLLVGYTYLSRDGRWRGVLRLSLMLKILWWMIGKVP